jgi:diguanylate cyclase (GGDEF)-like protein
MSRAARPGVELLESRGGFPFAVICLCLMSLAVALLFHRSFQQVFFHSSTIEEFVHIDGPTAVSTLDRQIASIETRDPGRAPGVFSLDEARETIRSLSVLIAALVEESETAAPLAATRQVGLAAVDALEHLNAALNPPELPAELGPGSLDTGKDLVARWIAAREAVVAYLAVMGAAEHDLVERKISAFSTLTNWLWLFLATSTVAGIVFLKLFRDEIAQRVARETAERRADFLAYFDPATGLPNRFQFHDRFADLAAKSGPLSVLLIDIAHFRKFNDRFGRMAGDVVLKEIAYRVRCHAETHHGLPARLSGDDFALLLEIDDPAKLRAIAEALAEACQQPVACARQAFTVSVSIGCAGLSAIEPAQDTSFQRIMRMADFALDSAKASGHATFAIYDAALERACVDRKAMAERLPKAIAGNDLQVFLQPQLDLSTGAVYGFEALVRWTCDGRAVSPCDLIRVAEQSGLIADLDRYVMGEAVRMVCDWNRRHRKAYSVSSNLSSLHLLSEETFEFITSCLERHGLPPELLTIEITESVELDSNDGFEARGIIARLRAFGCRIAIDDFGTGYSSFAYLQKFGADEIKIDRSFVTGIEQSETSRDILKTLFSLAASLGRSVVVEGIETSGQEAIVRRLGGMRVQGFHYGKPRPALEWLADTTYGPHRDRAVARSEEVA